MSTSTYFELIEARKKQQERVNTLASELDRERDRLIRMNTEVNEYHQRWLGEAIDREHLKANSR